MAKQMTGLIDKVTEALTAASQAAHQGGVSQDTIEAITQHVRSSCDRHRMAATQVQSIKPTWL
jgi:hypothetical protein